MIKINIISNNRDWYHSLKNPNIFIQKSIKNFNKKFKKYRKNYIFFTLLLSNNKEIQRLNKKFRKKDKTTDVLSFPFYSKDELKKKLKRDKEVYLGDIIVNLAKIKNKKNKSKFRLELNKLWVHGFTHLFGYDHIDNATAEIMESLETQFLVNFGIASPYQNSQLEINS